MAPIRTIKKGLTPSGALVLQHIYDLDEQIENLRTEIGTLKMALAKKYKMIHELETKRALQIQKEHYEQKLRRQTRILVHGLAPVNVEDDEDDEDDEPFKKSAVEHLNELCRN